MVAEFYHRHPKRLSEDNVRAVVATDLAQAGYISDRLKEIVVKRVGACWHYIIPVKQVVR